MQRINLLRARIEQHQPKNIVEELPEAGILVPLTREPEPQIIFTRRAQHMNTHKGQVAFPGGKYDEEDTTLVNTALRECHEEIGVHPEQVELLGPLSQVISLHGIRVSPFVGLVDPEIELKPNLDELDSIFKVPVSFFLNEEPVRRDRMTYKGLAFSVPSYDYHHQGERYEIWGLSAVVLVELMNIAFDANITIFDGEGK
jgi:8-oxo-dGTP pyrophosphatase MutT (NUDIX family)